MASADDAVRLAGLQRFHPVSRETYQRLKLYEQLLRQWQAKTNLVAPGTLGAFWERHVADSLQVLAHSGGARQFCDLGSGGGFPGMVIAIALAGDASRDAGTRTGSERGPHVRLVESNNKKCAFLRSVARQTGACASVHAIRIESATKQIAESEIVTARALAPLERLMELCGEQLTGKRVGLFHKGREYRAEIEECRGKWEFDLVVHPSLLTDGRQAELQASGEAAGQDCSVLLEVGNVRRARPQY